MEKEIYFVAIWWSPNGSRRIYSREFPTFKAMAEFVAKHKERDWAHFYKAERYDLDNVRHLNTLTKYSYNNETKEWEKYDFSLGNGGWKPIDENE